jgi:hypothetical protein
MSDHYPMKDGKMVFEQIDTISFNKAQLFSNSKKWIVENFKSSKSSIQSENPTQGQILGIGLINIQRGIISFPVKFNYQIDIKEKKYRFRIYNLIMVLGELETSYDDLPKETSNSLSANKYAKSAAQAKDFCKSFSDLLDSYKNSLIRSSKDDF